MYFWSAVYNEPYKANKCYFYVYMYCLRAGKQQQSHIFITPIAGGNLYIVFRDTIKSLAETSTRSVFRVKKPLRFNSDQYLFILLLNIRLDNRVVPLYRSHLSRSAPAPIQWPSFSINSLLGMESIDKKSIATSCRDIDDARCNFSTSIQYYVFDNYRGLL